MFRKQDGHIKSLIEQFHYPRLGPGMMWRTVADQIRAKGGHIRMHSNVDSIEHHSGRITRLHLLTDDRPTRVEGTDFISSMPLTEFVQKLDPAAPSHILEAAKGLKYRDFLTVGLIVNQPRLFDDNWIYVHDPRVAVGRIQNYKNWSPDMVPDESRSSLGLEYFCNEGDSLWNLGDEELVALGKQELETLGLVSPADIEHGCVFRVAKSYPVYDSDYRVHLSLLRQYVDSFTNFQTIGRNGLHRYNNQDHAMLTGMLAVENIVHGCAHDLWEVNAEQEYHEELALDRKKSYRQESAPAFKGDSNA